MFGFIFLIYLSAAIAGLMHRRWRNYFGVVFVSGLLTSVLFQCIGFILKGHLDKFVLIALPVGCAWACLVSAVIGLVFVWHREQKLKD